MFDKNSMHKKSVLVLLTHLRTETDTCNWLSTYILDCKDCPFLAHSTVCHELCREDVLKRDFILQEAAKIGITFNEQDLFDALI